MKTLQFTSSVLQFVLLELNIIHKIKQNILNFLKKINRFDRFNVNIPSINKIKKIISF